MDQHYVPQGELATQVAAAQNASSQLSRRENNMSKKKRYLLLIVAFVLAGIGVYLILKGLGSKEEVTIVASPSPTVAGIATTPTPQATEAPDESVSRTDVEIEVLNGTGISGEAGLIQSKLEALGYKNVDVANADSTDYDSAVATFSTALSGSLVDEIAKLLESTYDDVETKTSSSLKVDVQIITGTRPGQAKASASPEASPSPSASPEAQ